MITQFDVEFFGGAIVGFTIGVVFGLLVCLT